MKYKFIATLLCIFFLTTCTEPVAPEFEFKSGLMTVEAIVSTSQGISFVTINQSVVERDRYSNIFMNNAEVFFMNTNSGAIVTLVEAEDENIYLPPVDFSAAVGEVWELDIKLQDGRNYKSLPETVLEPIAISATTVTYEPEFIFNTELDRLVPGHSISVDFDDPPNQRNYYYWNFRSFEKRPICEVCTGHFRDGVCNVWNSDLEPGPDPGYYTYICESDCWRIRYNENIKIFEDEFANGSAINQLPIADILLYTKEDILVEVQQFSLSKSAYDYYKVLKDLVDNNSGFNAPPPAALVGNMFNPNDNEEYVLGRFSTASGTVETIFIERDNIEEGAITGIQRIPEGSVPNPWPPLPPGDPVLDAPCIEGRYITGTRPEHWPAN